MDLTGETFIAATRDRVWAGLNDPEILRRCIPGCTAMERLSDTEMRAGAGIKLGPVAAKFQGKVTLSDLDPPNGYTITGEGQGGAAGFARGGAAVRLTERDGGTALRYTVQAQVGGKIAQLGGRLIDATAKAMAEQFFQKFSAAMEAASPGTAAPERPAPATAVPHRGAIAALITWLRQVARAVMSYRS